MSREYFMPEEISALGAAYDATAARLGYGLKDLRRQRLAMLMLGLTGDGDLDWSVVRERAAYNMLHPN
jgi:hypothetical protein